MISRYPGVIRFGHQSPLRFALIIASTWRNSLHPRVMVLFLPLQLLVVVDKSIFNYLHRTIERFAITYKFFAGPIYISEIIAFFCIFRFVDRAISNSFLSRRTLCCTSRDFGWYRSSSALCPLSPSQRSLEPSTFSVDQSALSGCG